jgi:SAM-dependent methyltransferase
MKLSEIVAYANHLDTLSVETAAAQSMCELDKINQIVQASAIQIPDIALALIDNVTQVKLLLQQYEENLKKLQASVFDLIQQQEPKYFADSTSLYQEMRHETPEHILNRTSFIDPDTEQILCKKLAARTNWQYPGMAIRPAYSVGLESLVALDPLYLVDTHDDLFSPVRELFTPEYQRRLRYYRIEEYTHKPIFWNLPQQQFGFVCAFRYFDFKPWEVLQQYLNEIFELLRPGGTFLFSFNDCDQWKAVGLVEHHFCCYIPGRHIKSHVQDCGYEIVDIYNDSAGTSWMELRKPGILNCIRGGQAVAGIFKKIKPVLEISGPEVIDKSVKVLYNELDLDMLIELADVLNVDISQAKTKREFNIKKVRNTISAHLELINHPEETLRQLFKPKENK